MPDPTEDAATRKFSSVGWQDLFKVSTLLLAEKEIDVDDREAKIYVTLEMRSNDFWPFKVENLKVILEPNKHPDNHKKIKITDEAKKSMGGDGTEPSLVLFDSKDGMFPGAALSTTLTVQTGVFSNATKREQSAGDGLKDYPLNITYDLVPVSSTQESAYTTHTEMFFYVAAD